MAASTARRASGLGPLPEEGESASEVGGGGRGAGAPAEEARQELARVQEVLEAIFDYYSIQRQDPRMTSARFQRMCTDSCIIGPKLPSAKVDVTFSQVCGSSPHMTLPQFRDGIVRLSALKFPTLPRSEAVLRLYNEHLSAFEGRTDASNAFASVGPEAMAIVAAARPGLQTLYEGYFTSELAKPGAKRPVAAGMSEAQGAFLQVLTDFEVVPDLVAKAAAHAVFREVSRVKDVPAEFWEGVMGGSGRTLGRHFTFAHFLVTIVLAAHRCFADHGPGAVVRFLEWMDSSKGRVLFSASFPRLNGNASLLRLAPERHAHDHTGDAPARRSSVSSHTKEAIGTISGATAADSINPSPALSSDGSVSARARAPASLAAVEGGTDAGDARRRSMANKGAKHAAVAGLPDWARKLALNIFLHYASLGDPLNRVYVSSLKFNRFLRDCGLLSNEGGVGAAASPALGFNPARRGSSDGASSGSRRSASWSRGPAEAGTPTPPNGKGLERSESVGMMRRSFGSLAVAAPKSGANGQEAQKPDGGVRRTSVQFAVSPSKGSFADLQSSVGLPLRVFHSPPLSSVDADLVFVQAVNVQETASQSSRRPSISGTRFSVSKADAKGKGRHMTVDGFCCALADVASRCTPPECVSGSQALEDFCLRVLTPLSELLGEARFEELAHAVEILAGPEIKRILQRCQVGLDKVFHAYAVEVAGRRPHWTAESIAKFAHDFEIAPEVSHLPLLKVFQDCIHHESSSGIAAAEQGELSPTGFQLALLMISQKIYIGQALQAPLDRLVALFSRINTIAATPGCGARLCSPHEPLLPVPKPTPIGRSTTSAGLGSSTGPGRPGRQDGDDLSWAEVMAA